MREDFLASSIMRNNGQSLSNGSLENQRGVYPAIVVPFGTNDNSEQNRIRARIVAVDDETGKIKGKTSDQQENYNNFSGKDRGIADNQLVLCMPLLPEFFHLRPQVGEMVYVIMENPLDNAGVRYWIGPIVSSKLKLKYQNFEDSFKMFNKTQFIPNDKINSSVDIKSIFPQDSDVAVQGRNDADIMLKNREALMICGKFNKEDFTINTESPSYLRLKQIDNVIQNTILPVQKTITHNINTKITYNSETKFYDGNIIITMINGSLEIKNETNSYSNIKFVIDWLIQRIKESKVKYPNWSFSTNIDEFKSYPSDVNVIPATNLPTANNDLLKRFSQGEFTSTNINLYSTRGKFRGNDLKDFEKNNDLISFGSLADTLHPITFGDENIKLLDLIIRLLLEHIHTPEKPLLTTAISEELKKYTVDGKLQDLISNHIRVN